MEGVGVMGGWRPSRLRWVNFDGLLTEMTWCLPVDGDGDARRVTSQL